MGSRIIAATDISHLIGEAGRPGGGAMASELAVLLDSSTPVEALLEAASAKRDAFMGSTLSYSPKVFIDVTRLCRDRCAYCTFVRMPVSSRVPVRVEGGGHASPEPQAYLEPDEVLEIARVGARAGCKEALFTLGDRPEARYESAREFLRKRGYASTAEYLIECAKLVADEAGLLPHVNPGVMTPGEIAAYREVSVSAGLMLESTSRALYEEPGACHFGSPDKDPALRLECIAEAGRARVPFTTGMLIGIGESLVDRVETIAAIADLAREFGHIQEVIVQNFRTKPTIPMRDHAEPAVDDLLRVIALARIMLPGRVAVQAPPNLTASYERLLAAGLSDWGGISPVTPDHVNPEAPWPEIAELADKCGEQGFDLRARLAVHPAFIVEGGWIDAKLEPAVAAMSDKDGWAR